MDVESLVARYDLPTSAARALSALTELIATDPRAPTTVRQRARIVDDHLADSLVALELPDMREAAAIVDLGAGAGLPGLALAVALPGAEVALVESNERKHAFLQRAIAATGAGNATAVRARAEAWPEGVGRFDVVTARALAEPAVVAEYAAPLLRLGGLAVLWRGRRDAKAEDAAAGAAAQLGLEVLPPTPVHPYAGAEHRHLHLLRKVRPTPSRFPRRPGVARKRPLGRA